MDIIAAASRSDPVSLANRTVPPMQCSPPDRSQLRRFFVAGGLLFVVAASLGLIAYQEIDLPRPGRRTPVILSGQLFTRSPRIDLGGVAVHFRRPNEPLLPGRRRYVESAVADQSGRFSFEANFRGPAHLFLDRKWIRDWTYRPISDIVLPARQDVRIEIIEGAIAAGRVVRVGRPAAEIGMALRMIEPASHDYFWSFHAQTDSLGRFRFEHLPEGVEFWISSLRSGGVEPQPSDSLPDDQTFRPVRFRSGTDRTTRELGNLELRRGVTLAGRVVLTDEKAIPENWVVAAGYPGAGGWVSSRLDKTGQFRINGLPPGTIAAHVEVSWAANPPGYPVRVSDYRMSVQNQCLDPDDDFELVGQLDHDRNDLIILLEPTKGAAAAGRGRNVSPSDQVARARFEQAKAGPITGAAALH